MKAGVLPVKGETERISFFSTEMGIEKPWWCDGGREGKRRCMDLGGPEWPLRKEAKAEPCISGRMQFKK